MAFRDYAPDTPAVSLLQRSLESARLGHAYLFSGDHLEELQSLARALSKTINCLHPIQSSNGFPIDSCDQCRSCLLIARDQHQDIHWLRPESKLRIITVLQMRELLRQMSMKSGEGLYKVGVIVAADRLNIESANAFLKTLEEPPERSLLILLTTEPGNVLETLVSRCLRLHFSTGSDPFLDDSENHAWLHSFVRIASNTGKDILERYRLLGMLTRKLDEFRAAITSDLSGNLKDSSEMEPSARDKKETEITAAVEAEYRQRRALLLASVQWWFRDVWLVAQSLPVSLCRFPDWTDWTLPLAQRLTPDQALLNINTLEETQKLLQTNVQESLTLEVGLMQLHL